MSVAWCKIESTRKEKTMNEKIELLNRNIARHDVILALLEAKRNCDETEKTFCEVCYGFDLAIKIVNKQMENEE